MLKSIKLARREYLAAIRTKGFIIGLIIAPVLMSGGLIAFLLLKDNVDTTDKKVILLDHSGIVAPAIITAAEEYNTSEPIDKNSGKKIKPAYLFETVPVSDNLPMQRLELSDRVRRGELHAFVEIGSKVLHPGDIKEDYRVAYYAKNAALDDLRSWIRWPINNHLRKLRLKDAGINEYAVNDLFFWIDVEGMGLVSRDSATGGIKDARTASPIEAIAVPIALMMLMFLMVMMSVPGMLNSVMEEKTQRIAEVLLGSINPFEFMMGKLLGGIAVSLTSSAVYFLAGVTAVLYIGVSDYVPFHVLPWFFIFMLLAVVMFGALSAALGSTCSEPKDAQSLTFPSILPALIPMFIYFPVVKEPLSGFATTMSLIPIFTPLLMVLRMSTPESVPAWQPYVGLAGVLLTTLFFVWAGGRIFRVGILTQGTPPKLSNILRWALKG